MTAASNVFSDTDLRNPCAEIESFEPAYKLENDSYAFYLGSERKFLTEEVSVLLDTATGSLVKHGKPESVQAFLASVVQAYRGTEFSHLAENLACITGKFNVDELNKVLQIAMYAGRFYTAHMKQDESAPAKPLAWLVEFSEFPTEDSVKQVQHVVYEQPEGEYAACATPITDKNQLAQLLANQY